jgi:hypothetical protein
MKSWHSYYHKKANQILSNAGTNPPPEQFTQEEEEALIDFLARGGSFMIDTSPLLYGVGLAPRFGVLFAVLI